MKTRAQKEREARHWQARRRREQKHFAVGSGTSEKSDVKDRESSRIRSEEEQEKYIEGEVYKSGKGKKPVDYKPKAKPKEFSSEKSKHKPEVDQKTQLKPTVLEVINYKTGTQGYPENVEAFEKMVEKQDPHSHAATDLMSKEQWRRETEAAIPYTDFRMEKTVHDALNEMRKRWNVKGGDFSEVTKKWFKDHPADVIYLNTHRASYSQARKWAGFKIGLKGKGRKVTRVKMTPIERKKAKAEAQRRRAKEARRK